MARAIYLSILKVSMILVFAGWVSVWTLKPTNLWTKKWKATEDQARPTIFGYYGLDFAVYTFPVIALAIIGLVYLHFQSKEPLRRRQARIPSTGFSNPLIVNSFVGILSALEVLVVLFFILFLAWTFYVRISKDFKNLTPSKSLDLNLWQLKYLRVATRFGLLAEACLALLLLPVLRGLAIFQLLGVQFEASVRYHVWLGTSMIFFATFHGASTFFIWGVSHNFQKEAWRWQKTGRIYLAGEIALVTGLVIWITALPQIRRKRFEIFYYTHHLYIVFLILFLFHAGDRHFYMVFPGIFLFGIDKLLRIVQSKPESCILSARLFPNKAVELILPKDPSSKYNPTSVIFMKIPSISKYQWHSFSITSSSKTDDETMSVIIKGKGGWTGSLHDIIQAELDSNADHMNCIPIAIEGPYGPASVDFLRYDGLLLIAGGIGITPFLSILKEISSAQSNSRSNRFPSQIHLIYVVRKSQDICLLNSISHLLLNQSSNQLKLNLKVFVTQEENSNATLRDIMNDLSLVQTVNFSSTNGSNHAVHGQETPLWRAFIVALAAKIFLIFLMCLNHIFIPYEKEKTALDKMMIHGEKNGVKKGLTKEKNPSSTVDLILLSSFIIAITLSAFTAIMLKWKRVKKDIPPVSQKQSNFKEPNSMEFRSSIEEHEVHFGGRPNFQDEFSKFSNEIGGSDVGVLVCGPETMKEAVASLCQLQSLGFNVFAKGKKPYFNFHSLNFTL